MRIIIDATGGDRPASNIEGALEALKTYADVEILLAGPKEAIEKQLQEAGGKAILSSDGPRLSVLDAPDFIGPDEHPVMALRQKKNSPFGLGMEAIRAKEADAFVSAGSTGAVMASAMFKLGRIKGVTRPALATVIPAPKKPLLLLDAGANVDCKPSWLLQFALMGSIYMERIGGVAEPDVGLLNIGVEEAKGNELSKQAYALLSAGQPFRFVGNIEARDALFGLCDVLVTDGFAGNILLKNTEGLAKLFFDQVKQELMSSVKGKLAGALARDSFRRIKHSFDATEVGGAPLLGVEGAVIKAHGNSNGHAMFCAVRQARTMVEEKVPDRIREGLGRLAVAGAQEE